MDRGETGNYIQIQDDRSFWQVERRWLANAREE